MRWTIRARATLSFKPASQASNKTFMVGLYPSGYSQARRNPSRRQHFAIDEQQGCECLTVRGCRNLALVRQPGQKRLDFTAAQACWVTRTVETDEGANPVDISLLGSYAVMLLAHALT